MNDDRIIDIETKLAYQEDLLSALNDALTDQQSRLARLEESYKSLIDRVKFLMDHAASGPSQNQPPPHY